MTGARAAGTCLAAGVLAACRFGGPSGDPGAYVFYADGSTDDASEVDAADATVPPSSDGAAGDDATDDGSAEDGGDSSRSAGNCEASVPVCDPVHNTGCAGFQQCDVDPSQPTTPTGLCVFGSASDAGPCSSSIVNESCAPGMTCITGACRSLCYCDSDCPTGQCCSDPSGPSGFLLCQPCP